MPRTATPDIEAIAPGSVLLSALVGIALAAAGFVVGVGATGLADGTTAFWYLSRASGFVAYALLWGSVTWGLFLSTGLGRAWVRPPQLLDAHQFLSAAAVGFGSFHGLVLMGDRYVSFPLRAVVVPFAGRYEPLLCRLWPDRALALTVAHRQLSHPSAHRRASVATVALHELRRIRPGVRPRNSVGHRQRDAVGRRRLPRDGGPSRFSLAAPHPFDYVGARSAPRTRRGCTALVTTASSDLRARSCPGSRGTARRFASAMRPLALRHPACPARSSPGSVDARRPSRRGPAPPYRDGRRH